MAKCITCGKVVADTTKTHRCKACGQREATIARGGKVVAECVCKQCGKSYMPKQADRSTCCSRECGFKWKVNEINPAVRDRIEKATERDRLKPFTLRECVVCSEMWIVTLGTTAAKTCGSEWCKRVFAGARTKAAYHGNTSQHFIDEITSRKCRVCGDAIEAEAEFNAKDCMACRGMYGQQKREDRLKDAFIEAVSRVKVFERDRWTCMLCGKPVSRSRKSPHPMAPVVDHIIPVARGGTHEYKNVQCAHHGCNSKKSANMIGQLRLFG